MKLNEEQYTKLIDAINQFPEIALDLGLERKSAYNLGPKDYDKILKLKTQYENNVATAKAVEKAQDLAVAIDEAIKNRRRTEEDILKFPYKWTKQSGC